MLLRGYLLHALRAFLCGLLVLWVVDVAANAVGERVFLLAQSYMPAQDIHVLRNPASRHSPWYVARAKGELITPEWISRYEFLKRFPSLSCGQPAR